MSVRNVRMMKAGKKIKNAKTYSPMKKYLSPSRSLSLLHTCHTCMFQVIKLNLILDNININQGN